MVLRYSLCLLAGAFFPGAMEQLPSTVYLASVVVIAVGCHICPVLRLPGAFLLGVSLHWGSAAVVISDRLLPELEGTTLKVLVEIADFPVVQDDSARFLARIEGDEQLPRLIRLSWYEVEQIPRIGEFWSLTVRLRRPRGFANPGGFDYEAWLLRNRIGATGYVVPGDSNLRIQFRSDNYLAAVRRKIAARIVNVLPDDNATAVVLALAIGTRHRIGRKQWDQYAATGTSHLMAISGLHIGLAAGTAFYIFRNLLSALFRHSNARIPALWLALVVAAAYAQLSGFAIPARRALLMMTLAVIGITLHRRLDGFSIVALICAAVVVSAPLSVYAAGFQLSFVAVALLLWLNRIFLRPALQVRWRVAATVLSGLERLTLLQVTLLLGLFPIVAITFGRVAWLSPLVNLLVLPIFNFLAVPACLLGVSLVGPLQFAGDALLQLSHKAVTAVLKMIDIVAGWKITHIKVAELNWPMLVAAALVSLAAIVPRGWPCRHVAWLLVLAAVQYRSARPPADCFDMHVLDVGQGLAAAVVTENRVLVYDAGPAFRNGGDTGQLVVGPFLDGLGIDSIDLLVISHADLDHSGGARSVIASIDVGAVLSGEPLSLNDDIYSLCESGQQFDWDGVRFQFLHPNPDSFRDGNDASCVLLVSAGTNRALLTGDIGARVERDLVDRGVVPEVELVTVPHHGSRTSSSEEFVGRLSANHAVVSSGYRNRWNFPREDVVARWRAHGTTLWVTATDGAVGQRICRGQPVHDPVAHRATVRGYWSN